jgi:hypothetical protein
MKLDRCLAFATVFVAAAAGSFACSTSNPIAATNKDAGISPPAGPVTQHITAAAGGTVADATGAATLTIPAGSLSADLDITLAETAPQTGTVSNVYDFGPSGTQFSKPATLVLQMPSGVTIPTGQTPTLATYDGTKWAAITGSSFASGAVSGPVAHFSMYSIILVNGQATVTDSCSSTVTGFTACGGSLVGTWNLTDFCVANGALGGDPTDGGCPGASMTGSITPSGSITFNSDGSYSQSVLNLTLTQTLTIPTSCVPSGKTCDPTSLNINTGDGGTASCAVTGANCVCTGTAPQNPSAAKSGTYTTSGTSLTTDDGGATPYCVQGTTLTVQDPGKSGSPASVIVATKQ